MTDTSQQALSEPHTNGLVDGLTEEEKSKMRPADIDADMREMERRKRVEMMMNSRLFREELERIIETQMKDGAGPSGLLQQISDMMGAQGARFNGNVFKNSNCVLPINDIRGVESMGYAKGEKLLRCKLAAVFRLLDLYGWTQGVGGQITARLNQDQEHFLVNPYGLLYHEITASSLIKVDMQGAIVEQGTTNFGVHVTGFQLHSTIHAARPDIKCIIHLTTPSVTAISSLKCGLLPIGQESIVIGEVSNHQYVGGYFEPEEKEKIARNLGPINKVMLLTNRGALCCGETVEEAFFNVYNTVLACETQLKLMPTGLDNLNLISEESKKAIFEASRKPPTPQQGLVATDGSMLAEKLEKRWRIGSTEFEALMRMLDNAGFRTGYIYRNPLVKGELPRPRNDVEVPPAVSSLGYLLEEEELYKQGLWKGGRKGTDRSRWLNSPNVYQKVEILETGTPDPKKITKWVSDGSPTHSSTPVKIESALQFVPKNTNPKEFKQIQQQIKDYRRADKISAGPQSHILEGVTWEEAKKMQDATISGTGEQVVLVGAASKGIIQRGFQHNAMVYKTPYAKNPFDAITDQELDQYKKEIERKQKGDPYDESQSESEALSSFNISRATHESSTAKSPVQSPVSVTSETEEESRDEPRVLRIETKQVPAPSQPEVVLSDADASTVFLREMRQAEDEQRYEANGQDCGVSSGYYDDERSEGAFCGWLVAPKACDSPRLEVVRSTSVAERMIPSIIVYSTDSHSTNLALKQGHSHPDPRIRSQGLEHDAGPRSDSRRESIGEIINGMNGNITPSETEVNVLPRTSITTRYNLNSADMNLVYSLTPFGESRDLALELTRKQEINGSVDLSFEDSNSCLSMENHFEGGSDILELPIRTVTELREISYEHFRDGIESSANEIIDNIVASSRASPLDNSLGRSPPPLPTSSPPPDPQSHTFVIHEIVHRIFDAADYKQPKKRDPSKAEESDGNNNLPVNLRETNGGEQDSRGGETAAGVCEIEFGTAPAVSTTDRDGPPLGLYLYIEKANGLLEKGENQESLGACQFCLQEEEESLRQYPPLFRDYCRDCACSDSSAHWFERTSSPLNLVDSDASSNPGGLSPIREESYDAAGLGATSTAAKDKLWAESMGIRNLQGSSGGQEIGSDTTLNETYTISEEGRNDSSNDEARRRKSAAEEEKEKEKARASGAGLLHRPWPPKLPDSRYTPPSFASDAVTHFFELS
ncbi:hypothetical protein KM043_003374 [Ampulex compressa]|nr:hypothetical protein KM043_003374 [Ampulex compressa]